MGKYKVTITFILLALVVSLIPGKEDIVSIITSLPPALSELKYPSDTGCTAELQEKCASMLNECNQRYINIGDLLSGIPRLPASARANTGKNCMEKEYNPLCEKCGIPKVDKNWWALFRENGPWFIKYSDDAQDWWSKYISPRQE